MTFFFFFESKLWRNFDERWKQSWKWEDDGLMWEEEFKCLKDESGGPWRERHMHMLAHGDAGPHYPNYIENNNITL